MPEDDWALQRTQVPSSSCPGRMYPMARGPSGWYHEDEGCPWWYMRPAWEQDKPCKHVRDLNKESGIVVTEETTGMEVELARANLPQSEILRLVEMVDEFDAQLIVTGVSPDRVESWGYAFPQDGAVVVGLSVWGVAAAVREMGKHGEVVDVEDPKVTFENDDEARFTCRATRFIINPETGARLQIDSTVRALRQTKKLKVREYAGPPGDRKWTGNYIWVPDEKWFEKGYAKVVRNASMPLLREDCKSAMLQAFRGTDKYAEAAQGQQGRQRQRSTQQQPKVAAQAPKGELPAPTVTPEQETEIKRLVAQIQKAKPAALGEMGAAAAEKWPYAKGEKSFVYHNLKSEDVPDFITFLGEKLATLEPAQ